MDSLILGIIAFFTSTLTGVFGMGGGLLLLGFMPIFLPPSTIIPVHGITQLVSNSSRAYFSWRDIQWDIFKPYVFGGIMGTACFSLVLQTISLAYLPLFIGAYILLSQWSNVFNRVVERIENYTVLGFLQVGLSLFSGTIGPVHMVLLNKHYNDRNQIVATAACLMTVKHSFKVIAFIIIGVHLWEYVNVILTTCLAAILGSYVGTKLRGRASNKNVKHVIKALLTILAIRMIVTVF